jgi:Mce-associated membrane protein
VNSTSTQTPDGGRTTVTYNVTVDQNNDWKITDVGGVDSALPGK